MITIGSFSRHPASLTFPFLAENFPGRRRAIKEFTHLCPDLVFWIDPNGALLDAGEAHRSNPPKGHEFILRDEPEYGGFLRGRMASNFGPQLIVIYCRPEALATDSAKMEQFLAGISQLPIPHDSAALVISDNGDIYGLVSDIEARL